MPKIIGEARSRILQAARQRLLSQGYGALSLRAVAQECSIAVGTIYNYFKDKNTLAACVMMEDWAAALDKMDACCAAAATPAQGMVEIHRCLGEFAAIYEGVWQQFLQAGGSSREVTSRHQMLRGQIAQRIEQLLQRLGCSDAVLAPLLAETVLAAAMQPDIPPRQLAALADRLR